MNQAAVETVSAPAPSGKKDLDTGSTAAHSKKLLTFDKFRRLRRDYTCTGSGQFLFFFNLTQV